MLQVVKKLIFMVSKPVGYLNDELAEDDKTCEIEEFGWWITKDSLKLAKNFGLRLLVTGVSFRI